MTDAEMEGVYGGEYTGEGYPKLDYSDSGERRTPFQNFARHCYLNCIVDAKVIADLWVAERARMDAELKERKKQRRKR